MDKDKEVERLKQLIDSLSDEDIKLITRGERPNNISYNDFKVIHKTITNNIKSKLKKGKLIHPNYGTIKNDEGKEQEVKYKPYVNKENK